MISSKTPKCIGQRPRWQLTRPMARWRNPLLLLAVILIAGASLRSTVLRGDGERTSPNWAGYVVPISTGASMVSASWKVPALNCHVTPNALTTTWVGIGGFGPSATWPFPQTGVDTNCVYGKQVNDSWCSHSAFKTFNVSPGNVITAKILYRRGKWICSVRNLTTNSLDVRTLSYSYDGTTGTAEWVVESTTVSSRGKARISKLVDFGSLTFTNLKMFPKQWTPGHEDPRDNLSMSNSVDGVIASPTWSGNELTIRYK